MKRHIQTLPCQSIALKVKKIRKSVKKLELVLDMRHHQFLVDNWVLKIKDIKEGGLHWEHNKYVGNQFRSWPIYFLAWILTLLPPPPRSHRLILKVKDKVLICTVGEDDQDEVRGCVTTALPPPPPPPFPASPHLLI